MLKLKRYIDSSRIFPTEWVVGNDNNQASLSLPYEILFIHYAGVVGTSKAIARPLNFGLDKKVLKGEFPPDLYAHLCDERGYALDGKMRSKNHYFGANFGIAAKKENNPDFRFDDKRTWKQILDMPKRTASEQKALNERRRAMNMESMEDLEKKVRYEMNNEGTPFRFVNGWYLAVMFDVPGY